MSLAARARERRVIRRLDTRGQRGLGQALLGLRGTQVGERFVLDTLYAVGAEGAVFLARDLWDERGALRVAKVALLPYHKPFQLSFDEVRRRREGLRAEASYLEQSASDYMPQFLGLFEVENPLLDPARGGAFAETEPVLVMERLPGFDLDLWLARVHSSRVPRPIVRNHVDHVAVVVLRGVWDLHERGFFYTDLRPGNVRIRGRSEHRVRLMDAGSLVPRGDTSGGFPHVPAYLPPDLFWKSEQQGAEVLVPTPAIQAVMAGRALYEVATARVPVPGEQVDPTLLVAETVSPEVADAIDGLCQGDFADVFQALKYLAKRANRRAAAGSPGLPVSTPPVEEEPRAIARVRSERAVAAEPGAGAGEHARVIARPAPESHAALDLASALAAARASWKPDVAVRVARAAPPPAPPPLAPAPRSGPYDADTTTEEFSDTVTATADAPGPCESDVPTPDDDAILPPARRFPWWRRLLRFLRLA